MKAITGDYPAVNGWEIGHIEIDAPYNLDSVYFTDMKRLIGEVHERGGINTISWHGVRGCAAGLRYVLYLYLTDLEDPTRLIAEPAGYFIAPVGEERIGDVSNVAFSNGWIADEDGKVFIYYASSDTRMVSPKVAAIQPPLIFRGTI